MAYTHVVLDPDVELQQFLEATGGHTSQVQQQEGHLYALHPLADERLSAPPRV